MRSEKKLVVTNQFVAQVMRKRLKMRYKKVQRTPFAGNSDRSLALRFLCAKVLLGLLAAGKRLINIDESWLSETDLRRKKWRCRGEANSLPSRDFGSRLSLLMAVDTDGNSYQALSHANTDHRTFQLFIWRLTNKLSEEDYHWRQNSVFIMDGASYHKEATTAEILRKLGAKTVILAPYAYPIAPVELYFAHFKRTNLN